MTDTEIMQAVRRETWRNGEAPLDGWADTDILDVLPLFSTDGLTDVAETVLSARRMQRALRPMIGSGMSQKQCLIAIKATLSEAQP